MSEYPPKTKLRAVFEFEVDRTGWLVTPSGLTQQQWILENAESVEVIEPEIVPGQFYLDAEGKAYQGSRYLEGNIFELGQPYRTLGPEGKNGPFPPGLRAAKLVPVDES